MQDPMELWIKKAATDSDWDVIYVNISSCCSSPSLLAWFDLLSRLRFLFTITHSWLQAAPLIEYIVSQAAADSKRKLPALHLSCHDFSAPSLPPVCYTPACFSRSLARYSILQHCVTLSILPVFISSFYLHSGEHQQMEKRHFSQAAILPSPQSYWGFASFNCMTIPLCFGHQIGCSLWCYDHLVWMKKIWLGAS